MKMTRECIEIFSFEGIKITNLELLILWNYPFIKGNIKNFSRQARIEGICEKTCPLQRINNDISEIWFYILKSIKNPNKHGFTWEGKIIEK